MNASAKYATVTFSVKTSEGFVEYSLEGVKMLLTVGEIFNQFVVESRDTDDPIVTRDSEGRDFEWRLFVQREQGQLELQPDLTFVQNEIATHEVIYATYDEIVA